MPELARAVGVGAVAVLLVAGGVAFVSSHQKRASAMVEEVRARHAQRAEQAQRASRASDESFASALGATPGAVLDTTSTSTKGSLADVGTRAAMLRQVIGGNYLVSQPQLACFRARGFARGAPAERDEFTAALHRDAADSGVAAADVDRTLERRHAERADLDAALTEFESELARAVDEAVADGELLCGPSPDAFADHLAARRARGVEPLFEMQGAWTLGDLSECFLVSLTADDAPAAELARRRALDLAARYEGNVRAELGL